MQTNHWIWQNSNWPEFSYDASVLLADIGAVSRLAGRLDTIYRTLNNEEQLTVQEQVLADDAMETSAIEGEVLRRSSVRVSIRRRLGLSGDAQSGTPRRMALFPYCWMPEKDLQEG